jgi:hypothetical protein
VTALELNLDEEYVPIFGRCIRGGSFVTRFLCRLITYLVDASIVRLLVLLIN